MNVTNEEKERFIGALETIAAEAKAQRQATEAQTLEAKRLRLVLQGLGVSGLTAGAIAGGASGQTIHTLLETFLAELEKVNAL